MAPVPKTQTSLADYAGKETLKLYEVAAILGVHKVTHATLHRLGVPHVHLNGPHGPEDIDAVRGALVSVRALERWLGKGGDAA